MKQRKEMPKISAKKLKALGGKVPFSSITPKPERRAGRMGAMPQRVSKPKARKPINPRNAKRAAKNQERAYGSKRAWIVAQPCAVCGYSAGPCDPAHAKGDGAGLKSSSRFLVPLCPIRPTAEGNPTPCEGCHRESHRIGVQSFEAKHGVDLLALADHYETLWQEIAA